MLNHAVAKVEAREGGLNPKPTTTGSQRSQRSFDGVVVTFSL